MKYFLKAEVVPDRWSKAIVAGKWYSANPVKGSYHGYDVTVEEGVVLEVHALKSALLDGKPWEVKTEE